MPKITFDYNREKNTDSKIDEGWKKSNFEHFERRSERRTMSFRDAPVAGIEKHSFRKTPQFQTDGYMSKGQNIKKDFPKWVAYALFSLLGAFAVFTPACSFTTQLFGTTFSMSFTAIDLFKMGFDSNSTMIDTSKFEIYFITVVSFIASFAASVLMKEKLEDKPIILILLGAISIVGIILPFGFSTIVSLIKEAHSICFVIQLVCAALLIVLNLIALKNNAEKKNVPSPKRRSF